MDGKQNIISDLFTGSEGKMPYEQTVRLIIYTIIAITVIILFIVGIKWLKRKIKGNDLVTDAKKTVNNRNLSYDDFTYKQMAASIYQASHGIGTTEQVIFSNLKKLKNKDDWKKLISAYNVDKDGFALVNRLIYELEDDLKDIEKANEILSGIGVSI